MKSTENPTDPISLLLNKAADTSLGTPLEQIAIPPQYLLIFVLSLFCGNFMLLPLDLGRVSRKSRELFGPESQLSHCNPLVLKS